MLFSTSTCNPGNTAPTMSHASPFAQCTQYTITVAGNDLQGLPLVAGPVPNPWSFTAICPLTGPANLTVTLASPDIVLSWDAVIGATGYKVYTAQNRFASFPSGWTVLGTPVGTSLVATGHGADPLTHYYIARTPTAATEGPNSSMGV